jgi:hypothetical protein
MDGDGGQLAARLASGEQTLDRLRKEVQEHARRLEASETVGVHPDWSTFLAALASVRGEGVVLQVVEVRATDADKPVAPEPRGAPSQDAKGGAQPRPHRLETYLVTLKGYGLSQSDVMGFVRRLEELGPLVDVRLNQTRAQPFQSVPAVGFDAECRLVERPPPHLTRAGAEPEAAP